MSIVHRRHRLLPVDGTTPPPDPTERLLRTFVRARDRGDHEGAQDAWRQLVLSEISRVRTIIATHRHDALPRGRVPSDARDDLAQEVFVRLHGFALEGSSVGEARAIIRQATQWVLASYVRDHVREDVRRAGSLDEPAVDGDGAGVVAVRAETEAADRVTGADEQVAARDALERAFGSLDPNKREPLRMSLAGYSAQEIGDRLGLTPDNVYQRVTRGSRQLRKALKQTVSGP